MSDTQKKKERSSSSSGGDSGGGGGEDDGKNRRRRRRGFVRYKRHFTRVAQNVLVPFKKAKKYLCYPPRSRPRDINNNNNKRWGCLCFAETPTLDSQSRKTTDPNDPELFTYDTLKGLVEKNDFYSRECNPHI